MDLVIIYGFVSYICPVFTFGVCDYGEMTPLGAGKFSTIIICDLFTILKTYVCKSMSLSMS